jgi:hypothetical protein
MILRWRLLGRLAGSKVSFEWTIGVGDTIPIGREKHVNVDRRQSQVACNAERAARSAAGSNPRHQANRVGTLNSSQDYLDLARGKFPTHFRLFLGRGRKNFELPTSSFQVAMIGSAAIVIAGMMSGRLCMWFLCRRQREACA